MKEIGIALLFGLCCAVGIRLGTEKTARLARVRALRAELLRFRERIGSAQDTLPKIASEGGVLSELLGRYLAALNVGRSETDAAEEAAEPLKTGSTEASGLNAFFCGLSQASRGDVLARVESLERVLNRAADEAENGAKQARVLKISGALVGAGLAILLL